MKNVIVVLCVTMNLSHVLVSIYSDSTRRFTTSATGECLRASSSKGQVSHVRREKGELSISVSDVQV